MASYRAVSAISEAVINLLSSHFRFEDFNNQLEFRIYQAQDFSRAMEAGVSLFLYRILPNGTYRTPTGRLGPNGRRYNTRLPVDLHFILTAWGRDASSTEVTGINVWEEEWQPWQVSAEWQRPEKVLRDC